MNTPTRPHDCALEFLLVKRTERLAPSTLAGYEASLKMFLRDTPGLPEDVRQLAPRHAMLWTATLADPDRSPPLRPGAINAYQRPVWVWFRWLLDNDYLEVDIPRRVKRYKVEDADVVRRTVSHDLHKDIVLKLASRAENPYRNVAIVQLLWYAGLRRSELAALDISDLDMVRETVLVRRGKGGKARLAGVDVEACLAVQRYIDKERGSGPGALFLSRTSRRLTSGGIRCMLRMVCREEDFTVAAHDYRRACAANLRAAGMDLGATMHHLGHSEPTMTLMYSRKGEEEGALRAYRETSPRLPHIRRVV